MLRSNYNKKATNSRAHSEFGDSWLLFVVAVRFADMTMTFVCFYASCFRHFSPHAGKWSMTLRKTDKGYKMNLHKQPKNSLVHL